MDRSGSTRMIIAGVVLAFVLLVAAVWAADMSLASSLAWTGVIVLVGVGTVAMVAPLERARDRADDQRDRMKQTTP